MRTIDNFLDYPLLSTPFLDFLGIDRNVRTKILSGILVLLT